MAQVVRRFLLVEAATFIAAAAIHGSWLISGYDHREARIAESIIAAVLLGGAAIVWARPAWTRRGRRPSHRARHPVSHRDRRRARVGNRRGAQGGRKDDDVSAATDDSGLTESYL